MNPALVPKSFLRWRAFRTSSFVAALAVFSAVVSSGHAQGTMTLTFESQPRGTTSGQIGGYTEAGMQFGMAFGPGSLILSGGGISGYPDNGTGYLEIPDGNITRLRFGYNAFPPTNPLIPFNLVSFDAAVYDSLGPQTLEVVGYKPMAGSVTNFFSVNNQTFQTYFLDSSFTGIVGVDVFNARWSLDNMVISGVPEPTTGSLVLLGAGGPVAWSRFRRNRRNRPTHK